MMREKQIIFQDITFSENSRGQLAEALIVESMRNLHFAIRKGKLFHETLIWFIDPTSDLDMWVDAMNKYHHSHNQPLHDVDFYRNFVCHYFKDDIHKLSIKYLKHTFSLLKSGDLICQSEILDWIYDPNSDFKTWCGYADLDCRKGISLSDEF
ncbi:hypothetical protein [Iodobacter fluviatilis]|uniref:Uncharacterized protein n=1 Tax=Iodobacter fluviatilis TaxID=537 RepID=A0A377Q5J3_9NEIS|nr:hypothetical protein [Iodobacter fluviatilis]TCU84559.1 hypothetical protein EV682_10984 [Iodobacter fluviatilis]STQ90025.1 Uncharacterised protein [Iodobacter fluviatilis]